MKYFVYSIGKYVLLNMYLICLTCFPDHREFINKYKFRQKKYTKLKLKLLCTEIFWTL